jgi:nuclear inhibitor of protein phosphatase 1
VRIDGTLSGSQASLTDAITRRLNSFPYSGSVHGLYDIDHASAAAAMEAGDLSASSTFNIAAKLGLKVPNLAPDLAELEAPVVALAEPVQNLPPTVHVDAAGAGPHEPSKKKYAKEAWPGKKPVHSFLV